MTLSVPQDLKRFEALYVISFSLVSLLERTYVRTFTHVHT